MQSDTFTFHYEGRRYAGFINTPAHAQASALIIMVPGSGKTDMAAGRWFRGMRARFTEQGFSCVVWNKAGCGNSEGVYDDRDIPSSAREAIAAIEELKRRSIPGSGRIGLRGLSRGGWVCPLIIASYPSIAFWISVSGPDDKEDFGYLLERNFLIEGRSKRETKALMKSWHANLDIARHGGTFEENVLATTLLRKDSIYIAIAKPTPPTRERYLKWQRSLQTGENMPVDEKTGLQIYVPDFDRVLKKVHCPVLAIFGEKDSQVDWRRSRALYKKTIGKNPLARLTVKTFADGNHILLACKTGGLREKLEKPEFCKGYYDVMVGWLKENAIGNDPQAVWQGGH